MQNKVIQIPGVRKRIETHYQFFVWLGDKLGYKCLEDWYQVTAEDFNRNGGGGLLRNSFGNSPSKALKSIYPDHEWKLWNFKTVPQGYWEKTENQRAFFDRLSKTLGYECLEDWYNVTREDIIENRGGRLLNEHYNGSPSKALQTVYPQHNWM